MSIEIRKERSKLKSLLRDLSRLWLTSLTLYHSALFLSNLPYLSLINFFIREIYHLIDFILHSQPSRSRVWEIRANYNWHWIHLSLFIVILIIQQEKRIIIVCKVACSLVKDIFVGRVMLRVESLYNLYQQLLLDIGEILNVVEFLLFNDWPILLNAAFQ